MSERLSFPIRPVHIILALSLAFGGRAIIQTFFDKSVHRGPWYNVNVPVGWEKTVDGEQVTFTSPEKDVFTEAPLAIFTIYAKKSTGALFIEDLMIEIIESLPKLGAELIDKGEIKIDNQISKWVLYRHKESEMVVLSFFMVDDFNRLTKLEMVTTTKKFTQYKPEFEKFKASFKFTGIR